MLNMRINATASLLRPTKKHKMQQPVCGWSICRKIMFIAHFHSTQIGFPIPDTAIKNRDSTAPPIAAASTMPFLSKYTG